MPRGSPAAAPDRLPRRARIDELCRHADAPEYQCRFQWRNDSVAFWDNRAVQHYASSDYFPDVRIMERAAIIGDRPRADGLVPSTVSSNRPGVV